MAGDADAVVVGSGPNGLAAAVTLAAAGLRVQVIEGAATIGGGCRTEELTLPGFWHDVCSAAHPLAVASPFFRRFDLAARGVRFASPGRGVSRTRWTAAGPRWSPGRCRTPRRASARDAAAYQRLLGPLARDCAGLAELVLSPIRRPPRAGAPRARRVRRARTALRGRGGPPLPHRGGPGAVRRRRRARDAAAAPAADRGGGPDAARAGPRRSAGRWSRAAARGSPTRMAEAVIAAGGPDRDRPLGALAGRPAPRPAVLLDVAPRALLAMAGDRLPARYRERAAPVPLRRRASARSTSPCPARCRGRTRRPARPGRCTSAARSRRSRRPRPRWPPGGTRRRRTCLVTQPGVADPTRAPGGQHTLWAYCHVPAGSTVDMTARIEAQIERFAPGFRDLVLARHIRTAAGRGSGQPQLRRRGHRRRDADRAPDRGPPGGRGGTRTGPRCPACTCARRPPRRCPACTAGAANWPR